MRRLGIVVAAALVAAFLAAAPVSATPPTQVTITTITTDYNAPAPFTATGLPGCSSGLSYTLGGIVGGGPSGTATFHVLKLYVCDQSDSAFVMRIEAVHLAGAATNRGNWQVGGPAPLESNFDLGAFSNLHGGGNTWGEYNSTVAPNGVIDHMTGTVHFEP